MNQFAALSNRRLRALWLSQSLSAIGDQLFAIAIMWLSVQSVNTLAGIVAAAETSSALLVSLWTAFCVSRYDRFTVMIHADIWRCIVLLTIPICGHFTQISLPHLLAVAILAGSAGALYDPCLLACLPSIAANQVELRAANGLIDMTPRLARALAPALAGVIASVLSMQHFFTFDALTFLVSAAVLASIARATRSEKSVSDLGIPSVETNITRTLQVVRHEEMLLWSFASLLLCLALWSLLFTVGIPMLVKNSLHQGVASYGTLVAAYGLGNVASNVIMSNLNVKRPMIVLALGRILMGTSFLFLINTPNPCWSSFCAIFLAGAGGPMGDLMILYIVQSKVPQAYQSNILSLGIFCSGLGTTVGLLASPLLLAMLPLNVVLQTAAILMVTFGSVVFLRFAKI